MCADGAAECSRCGEGSWHLACLLHGLLLSSLVRHVVPVNGLASWRRWRVLGLGRRCHRLARRLVGWWRGRGLHGIGRQEAFNRGLLRPWPLARALAWWRRGFRLRRRCGFLARRRWGRCRLCWLGWWRWRRFDQVGGCQDALELEGTRVDLFVEERQRRGQREQEQRAGEQAVQVGRCQREVASQMCAPDLLERGGELGQDPDLRGAEEREAHDQRDKRAALPGPGADARPAVAPVPRVSSPPPQEARRQRQ